MATDEELIAAVASGDGRRLEELCRRWERPLYQLIAPPAGRAPRGAAGRGHPALRARCSRGGGGGQPRRPAGHGEEPPPPRHAPLARDGPFMTDCDDTLTTLLFRGTVDRDAAAHLAAC